MNDSLIRAFLENLVESVESFEATESHHDENGAY